MWEKVYTVTINVSKDKNEKIKAILEEAIKTEEEIGGKDIAKEAGMNYQACLARIRHDEALSSLFQSINHVPNRKKTESSKKIDIEIIQFLKNAVANKIKVLFRDISELTGLTERQAHDRIYRTPALKEWWDKLEHFVVPKKNETSKQKDLIIKTAIKRANENKRPLSMADLAKETGLSESDCSHRIHRNPDIKELWMNTKHLGNTGSTRKVLSKDAQLKLVNDIKEILTKANGESISFNEVFERINGEITKKQVMHTIYRTPELMKIWNTMEHKGGSNEVRKKYLEELSSKLETLLKDAIENETPLIFKDIAGELGITVPKIKHVIYKDSKLRAMWDRIPQRNTYVEPETSSEKTKIISEALDKIKLEKRKVNKKELAQELGMPWTALNDKIRRTPELREKWSTIERRTILKSSEDINDRLLEVIENAIKNKSFIGAKEIAELAGVSYPTCAQRLQKSKGILNTRWKELLSIKNVKNQELDNKIRMFLGNCITSRQSVNQKVLSEELNIPLTVLQYRFKLSDELTDLWNKVKTIDNETLKEFCELKSKKLDYKEIMENLSISEEKFDEFNLKYNKIQSIIEKSDIKENELIDWIMLSKRDFELKISEIFSKMGYNSKVTRYSGDNGIDAVVYKDGKKTIIECMHNIYNETNIDELMSLAGSKHYYDADNAIYVASSGVFNNGQRFAEGLGDNFRILTLTDIIKLAKQYNVDANIKSKINEISEKNTKEYIGNWTLPSKLSENETKILRNMKPKVFERKVVEFFEKQGYAVKRCDELDLSEYYLINKGGKRSIIKCHNKNTAPALDSVKALYGLRDYYKTDDVILIGPHSITTMSKDFIDTVNNREKDSYRIFNLDLVVKN